MNILDERKALSWSRATLASQLGWPLSRVWKLETGRDEPTEEELFKLAAVFNLNHHGVGRVSRRTDGQDASADPPDEGVEDAKTRQRHGRIAEQRVMVARDLEMLKARGTIRPEAQRHTEWEGFQYLDTIRIKGSEGIFRFYFHHVDDTQEYVQVFGGKGKRMTTRCFTVDRVVHKRRRVIAL